MTIRIWPSYSCNNSSSFRLVARFSDAEAARDVAAQLTATFAKLAEGLDVHEPSPALQTLAQQYGFDWGDGGYGGRDDGPSVTVEGDVLIVWHEYCLGLGPGIGAFLAASGGRVDAESALDIQMTVLFRVAPGDNPKLDEELATLFSHPRDKDGKVAPLRAPWPFEYDAYGRAAFYRDAGTVGLFFPTEPHDIAAVKTWLASHQIDQPVIRIDENTDEQLLVALASARCTACGGPVEYLDPRLHDIETPQLVCRPCGGLYELSTFLGSP